MKHYIVLLAFTVFLIGCSSEASFTSTTSDIRVLEKGYSDDYREAWIVVVDPNSLEQEEFTIMIEEPMVWNLIDVEKSYFSSYHKEGEQDWVLKQISNIGDDDTLR